MVRPPNKHSMVMVSSKTIENLQWLLQTHWNLQWFPKKHWTCQWSSQISILLKEWNNPVVTITILIWLFCSKVWVSRPWYLLLRIAVANETCLIPTNHFACFYIVTSSPPESHDIWDTFSVVLCEFHTVKWCKESIDMVHITRTLRMFIYVFSFIENWFYTLFAMGHPNNR